MVELSSDAKNGYRVERYTVEVLPRDSVADGNIVNLEAVAETVKRAWKKMATSTRAVALALSIKVARFCVSHERYSNS